MVLSLRKNLYLYLFNGIKMFWDLNHLFIIIYLQTNFSEVQKEFYFDFNIIFILLLILNNVFYWDLFILR